jgi:hypothetical protein
MMNRTKLLTTDSSVVVYSNPQSAQITGYGSPGLHLVQFRLFAYFNRFITLPIDYPIDQKHYRSDPEDLHILFHHISTQTHLNSNSTLISSLKPFRESCIALGVGSRHCIRVLLSIIDHTGVFLKRYSSIFG